MKIFISLITLVLSLQSFAQNISGQAFYESKTTVDFDAFNRQEMSEEMKKVAIQMMKSALEKTFILTFNKEESIYKEQEKLETGIANPGFRMMMGSFTPGTRYKNLKTGEMVEENEFFGKQFLITDTIQVLDWQTTNESKQIGQYIAFKATAIKKVDPNDFSLARPKKEENTGAKTDSIQPQDPMEMVEIPETIEVTAWFTPQIPVSHGPGEYAGLPGLILELNVYRTTLLCSKIVMNPKDAEKIEPPKRGTKVTRQEYIKIVKDKTDELRDNFRNSGGRRGGFGG